MAENQTNKQTEVTQVSANKVTVPKNNSKFIFLGSLVAIVILGLVIGFGMNSNKKEDTKEVAKNDSSQTSSASVDQDILSIERQEVEPDSIKPTIVAEATPVDAETQAKREEVLKDAQSNEKVNVIAVSNESLTQQKVTELKKEVASGGQTQSQPPLKVENGKQVTLKISYDSIGDQNFNEGSLYIKLSEGLKLVPGSIKDNFNNKGEIKVADSVYDSSKNLIKYGPGSTDKDNSMIKVGEKGLIMITVESTAGIKDMAISSYLQDKNGNTGKPGLIFIES
jgi:metal-dependent hydrolase (beta-lactamase superfamily II)